MISRRKLLAFAAAPLAPAPAATVLVHEHILVDFTGTGRWDADEAFRAARPKLDEIHRLGCRRFLDCTPAFLGRDPKMLATLFESASVSK